MPPRFNRPNTGIFPKQSKALINVVNGFGGSPWVERSRCGKILMGRVCDDWPRRRRMRARAVGFLRWPRFTTARSVAPGAHAVLIIDRAAWHTTGKLTVPPNITLLLLPPRAPELNPVENIWLFMRDKWLSNRIFKSYDEIVAICCEAWNKLIDQPWKIMSIGRRKWKWTHGF